MKISNPQQFLSKLDKETYAGIEERFGDINRFLAPGDKFRFACDRSGRCCKDRFDKPITLTPYDAYRLQSHLEISSSEFADRYGCKILGSESQLPLMLLEFERKGEYHNKCPFLRSYGCKVYQDRPTVCRTYPVGRIIDTDKNTYFFLTKVADFCKLGQGKEYTIEEWLERAEVDKYFEWNDRFNSLLLSMNREKYLRLDIRYKVALGEILYDPESIGDVPDCVQSKDQNNSEDRSLWFSYEFAKAFVKKFGM